MEIWTKHLPGYLVMEKNSQINFPLNVERVAIWANPRLSKDPTVCVYCSHNGITHCYREMDLYIVHAVRQTFYSPEVNVIERGEWFTFKTNANIGDIVRYGGVDGELLDTSKITQIEIIIDIQLNCENEFNRDLKFDIYYRLDNGRYYEQRHLINELDVKLGADKCPRYFKAI
jgi:hypothetical protein